MASLRYPAEIIADTTDWFSVKISDYVSGDLLSSGAAEVPSQVTPGATGSFATPGGGAQSFASIILPMPSNIQDGNSVSYGEDKLNPLTAAGISAVSNVMEGNYFDSGNIAQSVLNIAEKFTTEAKTAFNSIGGGPVAKNLILKALAAEAVNIFGGNTSVASILARESGQILNPNMELLFNGVTLRTFRFSFKMTPRDNNESANIRKIIFTMKKNMAAQSGGTFLGTPKVFTLEYKKGNAAHPFLHKFKPCFLKDMSVNYTGENVYATYSDGTPISMTMDLTFQEMFPVYSSDYGEFQESKTNNGTQGVGY